MAKAPTLEFPRCLDVGELGLLLLSLRLKMKNRPAAVRARAPATTPTAMPILAPDDGPGSAGADGVEVDGATAGAVLSPAGTATPTYAVDTGRV